MNLTDEQKWKISRIKSLICDIENTDNVEEAIVSIDEIDKYVSHLREDIIVKFTTY